MALTIAEHVKLTGRTLGFDYLRIGLSMSIILWHAIPLSYSPGVELTWWRSLVGTGMHFVLPMFFALSGFLVAGSLDRCRTLVSFFGLRVLRIIPALAVEVTLSALLFGPALTSFSLADYFTDPEFAHYFLNMIGDIHYVLPGLFAANPTANTVNAQLWTIPFELQCYLAIGGLATAGVLRRRWVLLAVVLLSQCLWAWRAIALGDNGGSGGASGPVLVISFLSGILFHLYRDRIQLRLSWLLIVLAAGFVLSSLPHGAYYLPILATYLTVYLGLLNPRATRLVSSGDYSYGLYLYGYPLQQAVASIGPSAHHWWVNVAFALPCAMMIAYFSWHFIEKPTLALRRHLPRIETMLISMTRGSTAIARPAALGLMTQRLLAMGALCGGLAGTLLLVNANERLAVIAVAGGFAAALLSARHGAPSWFASSAARRP